MKLQNFEYRSLDGHRLLIVRENEVEVLVCRITPRTEAAEQFFMDKSTFLEKVEIDEFVFIKEGYFNCDSSPLPTTIRKEKPKDSGKPIQQNKQVTLTI